MNTQNFTRANKIFTKIVLAFCLFGLVGASSASADWNVDFSRRARAVRETDLSQAATVQAPDRAPASIQATEDIGRKESAPKNGIFDTIFEAGEPVQEIVIMNTEKGFVPSTVRVRKNGRYKVSVVNVNEKEKNVSFILDGFSEHHSTYYGKIKTFLLEPKKDGIFSYQSPETAAEGRLIVFNPEISVRAPAAAANSTSPVGSVSGNVP